MPIPALPAVAPLFQAEVSGLPEELAACGRGRHEQAGLVLVCGACAVRRSRSGRQDVVPIAGRFLGAGLGRQSLHHAEGAHDGSCAVATAEMPSI